MPRARTLAYMETGRTPHWHAAIWAGLIAGLVFIVVEMLLLRFAAGVSPWLPLRIIGALLLGPAVLPPPVSFDTSAFLAAMLVHFGLAVLYGLILAYLIFRLDDGPTLLLGALFGLALYFVNYYGFTALFPWFVLLRSWIVLADHVLFGLTAAWAYKLLARREMQHAM
ncbi:MAG: hypothetical protein ACOY5C_11635 [Pseudomonadota bacterium]|uniref:hypothetical protein n=1 Tax=Thermithiobacillus tepidarius TaxID=929 RepID=UPI001B7FB117|nr:hypothetical protein [Thermithiobacillus tepidarius]